MEMTEAANQSPPCQSSSCLIGWVGAEEQIWINHKRMNINYADVVPLPFLSVQSHYSININELCFNPRVHR